MKSIYILPGAGLLFFLFFTSCESTKNNDLTNSEFRLIFSDGTEISEADILFYDSTTHFIFLKRELDFNTSISGFTILVDEDTICKGIIYSCFLSSPPPAGFYITDCFQYGHDILELGCYHHSPDLLNSPRIIEALQMNDLLRTGLTCTIDSLEVKNLENSSQVICRITITNHDRLNYYIPDPGKMGETVFNYYTGGIFFSSNLTGTGSFLKWSESLPDYAATTLDDFSILPGKSKISYHFESADYYKLEKGKYNAKFRFCGLNNNIGNPAVVQKKGRIWIGEAPAEISGFQVE